MDGSVLSIIPLPSERGRRESGEWKLDWGRAPSAREMRWGMMQSYEAEGRGWGTAWKEYDV
jgi:hypothetical protein